MCHISEANVAVERIALEAANLPPFPDAVPTPPDQETAAAPVRYPNDASTYQAHRDGDVS